MTTLTLDDAAPDLARPRDVTPALAELWADAGCLTTYSPRHLDVLYRWLLGWRRVAGELPPAQRAMLRAVYAEYDRRRAAGLPQTRSPAPLAGRYRAKVRRILTSRRDR